MLRRIHAWIVLAVFAQTAVAGTVSGELKKWHTVTLDFVGPAAVETGSSPNPFLDYRLQVSFAGPGGQIYDVPGFFAGDGVGGSSGSVWRVRFTPDEAGVWNYVASFRSGAKVAIDLSPTAGTSTAFDGDAGSFTVAALDAAAPGNLAKGRLEYVGGHYLKYRDGGYFLKGGTDSPENYLAYSGFDNTTTSRFTVHDFAAHVSDWTTGDPDWGSGKGRGIIGSLNYLADQNVNSIYVMPMNIGGDGQDCWPFAGSINPAGAASNDNLHFDISKLRQWEIFFDHADRKGMLIQMVLNEAERNNKLELDNATLGDERKLYYRELAARFGHHLGLQWNMCEEYNLNYAIAPSMIIEWAGYLRSVDAYNHPIAVHNSYAVDGAFTPFLGSIIDMMSIQVNEVDYSAVTEQWLTNSATAGKKWVVMFDEFDRCGEVDDDSHSGSWPNVSGHGYLRKAILWPTLLSGGGVEYILEDLLNLEDFRQYEPMWRYTWYARKFLEQNTRLGDMRSTISTGGSGHISADTLVRGEDPDYGGAEVYFIDGEQYAIYLPDASNDDNNGGPPELDLRNHSGVEFRGRWYNPRTGQFADGATDVILTGGDWASLGRSPDGVSTNDWALLVEAIGVDADAGPDQVIDDADDDGWELVLLDGSASSSPNGPIVSYQWTEGGTPIGLNAIQPVALAAGVHVVTLTVRDETGAEGTDTVTITIVTPQLIADAGDDVEVIDSDGDGVEIVWLDGSESVHRSGTINSYLWTEGGAILGTQMRIPSVLTVGEHVITLTVSDGGDLQVSDTVTVSVLPAGSLTPGDANGDGSVDLEDFVILKANFGRTGVGRPEGDFDGDGDVDLEDFVVLKANFGA